MIGSPSLCVWDQDRLMNLGKFCCEFWRSGHLRNIMLAFRILIYKEEPLACPWFWTSQISDKTCLPPDNPGSFPFHCQGHPLPLVSSQLPTLFTLCTILFILTAIRKSQFNNMRFDQWQKSVCFRNTMLARFSKTTHSLSWGWKLLLERPILRPSLSNGVSMYGNSRHK